MTRLSPLRLFVLLLLCAAGASQAIAQDRGHRLVLLPLDNVSGVRTAYAPVRAMLMNALQKKGWSFADEDALAAFLEEERVRYFDSLDDGVRSRLLEANEAAGMLTVTIYTYSGGKNPIVALSAQLVRGDGKVAWADVAAQSADDTEGLFGAGREIVVDGVAEQVIHQLLRTFPAAGHDGNPVRGPSRPLFHEAPLAFRAAALDPAKPHRVCILPFENAATSTDAARVVAGLFALRMSAESGFDVVPPAELRAATLKAGIASFRTIASDDLKRLGEVIGTPLFLRGTVYEYSDPALTAGRMPSLEMELSLIDVESGHLLWTAHHDRKGDDYTGLLMLGAVSNGITLADRVVAEMIATATKRSSRRAPVSVSGRNPKDHIAQNHSKLRGSSRSEENE